jgi:hypothetical protein
MRAHLTRGITPGFDPLHFRTPKHDLDITSRSARMHLSIDAFTLQVIEVGDQDRSGGKRRDIHSGERHREQGVRLERQFRIRSICFRPCPKESLMSALLSMNHAKEQMSLSSDRLALAGAQTSFSIHPALLT